MKKNARVAFCLCRVTLMHFGPAVRRAPFSIKARQIHGVARFISLIGISILAEKFNRFYLLRNFNRLDISGIT